MAITLLYNANISCKIYLFVLFLLISVPGMAQQKKFDRLLNQYIELTNNEKYDTALVVTSSMQKLALNSFGKNSWQYIRALNSTGYVYKEIKKIDSALLILHKAYRLATQFKNLHDTVKFRPLRNLAECYVIEKNRDSAVYYTKLAIACLKNGEGEKSEGYINTTCEMADVLWDMDTAAAYACYTGTLQAIGHLYGSKSKMITERLLGLDDSLFNIDKEHYDSYLGIKKARVFAIFQSITPGYSIDECNTYIKEFIISRDYHNAFYYGLTALHESIRHEKENAGEVARTAGLLGYLYEQYYQVKPFANYFYSSFFQAERSRSAGNFKEYDDPPEKYVGDRHFVNDTSKKNNELQLVVPIGHTIQVNSLAFSPDKKYLLSTSYDKSAKIWEVATGKLIVSLNHKKPVTSAVYSPDGKYIITCPLPSDSVHSLHIWTNQGKLLKTLQSDTAYFNNAVFSPDSRSILVACGDDRARLFDIESGKLRLVLPHSSALQAEFSADGQYILTLGAKGYAHLWNGITGKDIQYIQDVSGDYRLFSVKFSPSGKYFALSWQHQVQVFTTQTQSSVSVMNYEHNNPQGQIKFTFSPDEREILACAYTDSVKIFEVLTGQLLRKFSTTGSVSAVAYHPDNKNIVVGQENLTVLNKQTGRLVNELKGHTAFADEYDISPDGKHIAIPDREGRARVWEIATAQLRFVLSGHHKWIWKTKYSQDGKYIATCSFDSTARIWEAATGRLVSVLKGHREKLRSVDFHPAGKIVITTADDNLAILWEIATGKIRDSVRLSKHQYNGYTANENAQVKFSTDGSMFVTSTAIDTVANVWDTNNRKLLHRLAGHSNNLSLLAYSPDGSQVLTTSLDSTARLWNLKTGRLIKIIRAGQALYRAAFSPDGAKFVVIGENNVALYNAATGTKLHVLKQLNKAFHFHFTADGQKLLTDGTDNLVCLWEVSSGRLIYKIEVNAGYMVRARFSKDEKNIIGVCGDGTTKIWDTATGKLRYAFFPTDSADYFMQIPSGYYQSTQNAAKLLHYVTGDMKVITFDQLDLKYNRPDKVQEGMGNTDTALVKAYRLAYYKRIRKMGVDTGQFSAGYSVPEADFKNRDAISYEQNQSTITLHITGRDSTYTLDRLHVWVNATPVFGQRGISLKTHNRNTIDTVINVHLAAGENRIETSVTNSNGAESYRMPLQVKYEPSSPAAGKLHFIGIGINQFADSKFNLKWSVKDIRDLALKLREKYKDNIVIDTLFDEDVSVKKVAALKKGLQKTGVNDKVIVAYSGHGLLNKDYDYYLSTYKVNFANPEQNGLPYDMLESLLDGIPARKKLMLIDACHSGEVDKEELKLTAALTKNEENAKEGAKGFGDVRKVKGVGIKNSFELMQSLFANVGRSTGATVISAAAGTQFALERNDLKNGVFTYSILEYMQTHPHATVSELKQVVNRRVTELTKGAQVPTARVENDTIDWLIW